MSYLEIYNETIRDLLTDSSTKRALQPREDPVEGVARLVVAASLDHETAPTISLGVRASDPAGLTATLALDVEVVDVNEPPVLLATSRSVNECVVCGGGGGARGGEREGERE